MRDKVFYRGFLALMFVTNYSDADKMAQFAMEERQIRDENLRLQRRLQLEMERREALCRHLSESESSLEMEDERHFHESLVAQSSPAAPSGSGSGSCTMGSHSGILSGNVTSSSAGTGAPGVVPSSALPIRPRPGSSPGPFVPSPGSGSRPMSPGEK